MKLHLQESINDKGILKAVVLAGPPGAGKSTVTEFIHKHLDTFSNISPRLADPDRIVEFLAKKYGVDLSVPDEEGYFEDEIKKTRVLEIANFINGVLPLWVASTSADFNRTMDRVTILESIGYAVGMLWVGTEIDYAIAAMQKRKRAVPLKSVYKYFETLENQHDAYQRHFRHNFWHLQNVYMTDEELAEYHTLSEKARILDVENMSSEERNRYIELDDKMEASIRSLNDFSTAKKQVNRFFSSPVKNPTGRRMLAQMKKRGVSYLHPSIMDIEKIESIVKKAW